MKASQLLLAGALALAAFATPASAIDVTINNWAGGDATIGTDVQDENDIVVKPCDCEPVANPGQFQAYNQSGGLVRIHYEVLEGTTITTTDGTVVGIIASVQNMNSTGPIVLVVNVEGGLLGTVDRLLVRRNAFYWTGSAAVIDTTIDDLRSSIRGAGLTA